MQEALVEHRRYIERYGEDMPLVRDWRWPGMASPAAAKPAKASKPKESGA